MSCKRYGLPYLGSKNGIAQQLIDFFPKCENFYDLFCGGGAVTHCAIENNLAQHYYMNDLYKPVIDLFKDAIEGKFKDRTEWISREEFKKRKDSDLYINLIWSFGNKGGSYLYGEHYEPWKKALHYAYVYGDNSLFNEFGIEIKGTTKKEIRRYIKDNEEEIKEKYSKWLKENKRIIIGTMSKNNKNLQSLQNLQNLENLERLQSLERLQRLERLESGKIVNKLIDYSSLSYEKVDIKPNSVVYCDIPYDKTQSYVYINNESKFNQKEFLDWACKQKELVLISSYNIEDFRFTCVYKSLKRGLLNSSNETTYNYEKIYCRKDQVELLKKMKGEPKLERQMNIFEL